MVEKVLNEPVYDDDAVNKKYVDKLIKELLERIEKLESKEE